MNGMKHPPGGEPMEPDRQKDKQDAEILRGLAKDKRCQQRLLTDLGLHWIYCGGYFHGKATKTKHGWRCRFHR